MTFRKAQSRLLDYIHNRLHNGEFTERGFARALGISQPHLHNVLKGARRLSPSIFDSMLRYFQLSLLELASDAEFAAARKHRAVPGSAPEVPFLCAPVGPGRPWPETANWQRCFPLPFPSPVVPPEYYMVDLFVDPDMPSTLASHRIALLDTSVRARREILPQALYVVVHGGDALLRRLREGARCAYLLTDRTEDNPVQWEPVELRTADPWHFVRARVLWLGSELDWDGPMDQRGRFL